MPYIALWVRMADRSWLQAKQEIVALVNSRAADFDPPLKNFPNPLMGDVSHKGYKLEGAI